VRGTGSHRAPPARLQDPEAPLQALFRSWFDPYRGVIVLVRVMQGAEQGQRIRFMSNGKTFEVESMGVLCPKPVEIAELPPRSRVLAATIKTSAIQDRGHRTDERDLRRAVAGLKIKPMVFAGPYTVDSHDTRC